MAARTIVSLGSGFSVADVVGIAPMAGRGTRLGLSISKELAPLDESTDTGPVLADIMLCRMLDAGITRVALVTASHKQDIRRYFGETYKPQKSVTDGLALSYVQIDNSRSTPVSIDAAYEYTRGKVCALGFADILFARCPGYERALDQLENGVADVVLGLFPSVQTASSDMVEFDADGVVQNLRIKSVEGAKLAYTWSIAVWKPGFTDFLHRWVADSSKGNSAPQELAREQYVGDVFLDAMREGMRVEAVVVSARASLDAGTPESLALARTLIW